MKKSALKIIFVTIIIFLSAFAPAFAALRAEPVARSPFGQRDRYETDLFTGSAVYSYPINVPKGTNHLTPEVSLTYSSAGARDLMQRGGAGWRLSQDYIERDINFTPTNTGDDKFKLHFKGSVYDLIYVSSENRYHTKTESFLNIQKLTGGQNQLSEYWQVITPDGTKYRFGYQQQSELLCEGRTYINTWSLDQTEDTHGNKIFYSYTKSSGIPYLTKIEYNNEKSRVVEFVYPGSPYPKQLFIQGCNVNEVSRLENIKVKTGGSIVRQYDLNYGPSGGTAQILQSIIEKGSDGFALPATTFTYKPEIKNWSTQPVKWLDHAEIDAHLQMSTVALTDVNGDGLSDIVRTFGNTWKVLLNQANSWSTSYQTWATGIDAGLDWADVRLVDVTGDSLPDIVKEDIPVIKVWRNTGNGWSTTSETWANGLDYPRFDDPTKGDAIVDLNGDGLADLLRTYSSGTHSIWEMYVNTGSSWGAKAIWWDNVAVDASLNQPNVRMADVNGDGLTDIVKTTHNGTNAIWLVYKNTGNLWDITPEKWIDNANIDAYLGKEDVTLADADGDGLVDIVKSDDGGGSDRWKILRNSGSSWSTSWETWIDPSSNQDVDVHNNDVRLADVNGDGLTDIVRGRADCSCSFDTWTVWKNNGKASNLLSTVKTAQGATISFDYKASTTLDNTGADDKSDLPFNLWVVEKKTENNGLTNSQQTNDITTYNFKDGLYKWQEREFRGFGTIDENLEGANNKKYVFHQDDALKGMLQEFQTRDTQGNPFAETENTWSSSLTNGVTSVKLSQEKNYTYDSTAANPKITQTEYEYDIFGNITKKSDRGEAAVIGDERFTYFEYVINPTLWITNTLKHTYTNGANDTTKVSEKWFYYDAHPGLDDQPTKGDVTKEVKWLEGGTNPVILYEYNSFGNQTKVTNANNHSTTYTYDSTGTHPATTTNAKNQTTATNYALGTGNLLSTIDPNNRSTTYEYDVFGRITKEKKPNDTMTQPTTNVTVHAAKAGLRSEFREA